MADQGAKGPSVGVGVIVVREGRVLVGKRRGGTGAGTWSTPGGFLQFFESFEDCARREVREEAGLYVNGLEVAAVTNDVMRAHGKHSVTVFMRARHSSGEPRSNSPGEMECWEWRAWDDLPEPLYDSLENLRRSGYRPDFREEGGRRNG